MKIRPSSSLPTSDPDLKKFLNYNPVLKGYTLTQLFTGRNPNETDRGGWRGYDRVYSYYLSHLRYEPMQMLEIGAQSGYGLLAWAKYFSNSIIHGIEVEKIWKPIHKKLVKSHPEFSRINIQFHSSFDPPLWPTSTFDVIIDDGSHLPVDQLKTFNNYWATLKPGGYYFIEDISTRYTRELHALGFKDVFDKLLEKVIESHEVSVYEHFNQGYINIIKAKSLFNDLKDKSPFCGIDYIAVIRKKKE